jgi:hypothetical protein
MVDQSFHVGRKVYTEQRILLLRKAEVNVPIIRDILKEEFGERVFSLYRDLYNFIYYLENSQQKEFDTQILLHY